MASAHSVTHTEIFDVPAPVIWGLLTDWGGIVDWMPAGNILSLELEGEGTGAIRYLVTGQGARVAERLDVANEESGILELTMLEPLPWGLESYRARGTLEALGQTRCRLTWEGRFTIVRSAPQAKTLPAFLEKAYCEMFRGIGQATGGSA